MKGIINKTLIVAIAFFWIMNPTMSRAVFFGFENEPDPQAAPPAINKPFIPDENGQPPAAGDNFSGAPVKAILPVKKFMPQVNGQPGVNKNFSGAPLPSQPTKIDSKPDNQYEQDIEKHNEARENFIDTREEFKKEKNDDFRQVFILSLREYLLRTVEMIQKQMELLKERVQKTSAIDGNDKESWLKLIDSNLAWLDGKKKELKNAGAEDLKNLTEEIRSFWRAHNNDAARIVGFITESKMRGLIAKADKVEADVAKRIEELKKQGIAVNSAEIMLTKYRETMSAAKNALYSVKQFSSDKPSGSEIKEAGDLIRQAYEQLLKIIQELKNLYKSGIKR